MVIGFLMGLLASPLWTTSRTTEVVKSAREAEGQFENFFACKWSEGTRQSQLQIKGDRRGARLIVFPYKSDSELYRITESTDLYYLAVEETPDTPESAVTLEISRVTGEMSVTTRLPHEAVKLLADICDRRIPPTECRQRIERIKGGSWINCMSIANDMECPKWKSGNNFVMRSQYRCERVERRF
jgi:hypothetical protein